MAPRKKPAEPTPPAGKQPSGATKQQAAQKQASTKHQGGAQKSSAPPAKRGANTPTAAPVAERILDTPIVEEMQRSFLEYSMSVIVARALPDVRDGLKPVHRRILYSLHTQRILPTSPYKKCARVTGDTMGKFHPHGDSAIYEALVRLAQEFSMRLPVIDGHGNFGSLDDPPAAQRYTECRLAPAGLDLLEGLGEDTVDFLDNYDGTEQEPSVLPAAFPNLLVNGAAGIAVGMATNIAPHNLIEVTAACRALLENPKLTYEQLRSHIKGPDFPCGALVADLAGLDEAYRTGKGTFTMRARCSIEDTSPRRKGIVVTELPYTVGPEKVIAKIKELVAAKKLQGIADVRDLSDRRHGLRLQIEVKSGFDPATILDTLYRLTPLQESFAYNAVALVDGRPRLLGLREMCVLYLDHRTQVVTRRSEYRRARAADRLHLVEGLLVALGSINDVVELIKKSKDTQAARTALTKRYSLSSVQAEYILEMPLRRLTALELTKLRDEQRALRREIEELTRILSSPKRLASLVSSELAAMADAHGTVRRTTLSATFPAPSKPRPVAQAKPDAHGPSTCSVVLTPDGVLYRLSEPPHSPLAVLASLQVPDAAHAGVVDASGVLHTLDVAEIGEGGTPISQLLDTQHPPVGLVPLGDKTSSTFALGTRNGVVKRVALSALGSRFPQSVITLQDDEVLLAAPCPDDADLVFLTASGQLLRTPATGVRPQGTKASGMSGIRLGNADTVVLFAVATGSYELGVLTDARRAKRTLLEQYPRKGRGTAGMRCVRFATSESAVISAACSATGFVCLDRFRVLPLELPTARRDGPGTPFDAPGMLHVRWG